MKMENKPRKNRRAEMEKISDRFCIAGAVMLGLGFFVIVGTVGTIETYMLPIENLWWQAAAGIVLMFGGAVCEFFADMCG